MTLRTLLLAALALCAVPAAAPAATVSVRESSPSRGGEVESAHLAFTASPGEINVVTLVASATAYVVRDTGAALTAGAGCSPIDAHTASCSSARPFMSELIDVGDLDDTVTTPLSGRTSAGTMRVLGGAGRDVLTGQGVLYGGPGPDVLTGGAGGDLLYGGAEGDYLLGGGGDDKLDGDGDEGGEAPAAPDQLDGGSGADIVSYAGRTSPVYVDLGNRAPDGAPAERDLIIAIESAEGGHAADVLAGDGDPNFLKGNAGDDVLSGRDGADALDDGAGADTLFGGPGPDRLIASNPRDRAYGEDGDDVLSGLGGLLDGGAGNDEFGLGIAAGVPALPPVCGAGRDRLVGAPLREERIPNDCEHLLFEPFRFFSIGVLPARRPGGVLSVPVTCARAITNLRRCDGLLTLRLRRARRTPLVLGRRRFAVAPGRTDFVRVTVRRSARRAFAAARRPLLDVQLRGHAVQRPAYQAPGGVDSTVRIAGRWRVRVP